MKFVSTNDFKTSLEQIWKVLGAEQELIITAKGKPIALLTPLDDKTLENTISSFRQARAIGAVKQIQQQSIKSNRDKISLAEINNEIKAVRKKAS
ncbi:MAG: hypothetical protein LBN20_02930 [Endomicrobium sp.]|jgi:antitoxin (DNA-binding transcriptional repressor) of toxin-antitoxin stability system|nr:hypothetical protein [Endomicrobium sp.]